MYLIFVSVNFRGLTENGIPVDFLFRCVDIYLLIMSFFIYTYAFRGTLNFVI